MVPNRYANIVVIALISTAHYKIEATESLFSADVKHFIKGRFITRSYSGTFWLHLIIHVTSLFK